MMTLERMPLLIRHFPDPAFVSRSVPWTVRHRKSVDLWKEVDITAIQALICGLERNRGVSGRVSPSRLLSANEE